MDSTDRPDPFGVRLCPEGVCFTPPAPGSNYLLPMDAVRLGERLLKAGRAAMAEREEGAPE